MANKDISRKGMLCWIVGGIVAICIIGYWGAHQGVPIGKPDHGPSNGGPQKAKQTAPVEQKSGAWIGRVIGRPVPAGPYAHIFYIVYIPQWKGTVLVDAEHCPLLEAGATIEIGMHEGTSNIYYYIYLQSISPALYR